ncbi:MAG: ATP-binding protein [Vulcanimicrobiaceae bacterium]
MPFVGRQASLETAINAWHRAADGRATVIFVSGPAGMGKSRFASECARAIELEGGITVLGETAAGGEHRPYEAFVDALRGTNPSRGKRDNRPTSELWRRLLDELLESHAEATFMDDRSARLRLFDAVLRGFLELSRARPVVIVLEDLHWAGSATIDLFEYVATKFGAAHILIIATFRNDELPVASPLHSLRRQLTGRGIATHIELDALSLEDAQTAFRMSAPPSIDDSLVAQAVDRSAGHPLVLSEALRDVIDGREISAGSAETAFALRLTTLSDAARTALIYGAVFGASFDLVSVSAATGWSDAALVTALSEPLNLGLIRSSTRPPGLGFSFTHHLAHKVVLESLSEKDQQLAHSLAANTLLSISEHPEIASAEIARHLLKAGEPYRAAEYFLKASQYALHAFANVEARALATSGLEAVNYESKASDFTLFALFAVREKANARLGNIDERREDARSMWEHSDGDASRACEALECLYDVFQNNAQMRSETLALFADLAKKSDVTDAVYAQARADHAFLEGDLPACRDAAYEAFQKFEILGNSRAALLAHAQYLSARYRLGEMQRVGQEISRLRLRYETCDDVELRIIFHRVASALTGESLEEGLHDARSFLDIAVRTDDRFAQARARQNIAHYLTKSSEHGAALRELERSFELYTEVGDIFHASETAISTATIRGLCGDHAGAEEMLGKLPQGSSSFPLVVFFTA